MKEKLVKTDSGWYAWVICACCTILMFCTSGLIVSAFSVYVPYIQETSGFNDVQMSLLTTIRNLFSILAKAATVAVITRIGLKKTIVASCMMAGVSFFLFGLDTDSFTLYCAASALAGFSNGLGAMVPISLLIQKWFYSQRTFALSICASGSAFATFLCPGLIAKGASNLGLGTTFFIEAAVILGIAVILSLLVFNNPESKGMKPYVTGKEETSKEKKYGSKPSALNNLMMLAACFMVGSLTLAFPNSNTLYYREIGFDNGTIASVVSFSGITLLVGKWLYGAINDKAGPFRTNFLFIGTIILGCLMGCFLNTQRAMLLYLSQALSTIGFALATVGISVWAENMSDQQSYAKTLRNYQLSYTLGGIICSVLPGFIAQYTGSYFGTRIAAVVMSVLILLFVQYTFFTSRDKDKYRKNPA